MLLKTILVNLNETSQNELLLRIAANVAQHFNAYLVGLYVIPAVKIYPPAVFEPIPVIFEAHRDYFKAQTASVQAAFARAVKVAGVRNHLRVCDSSSPLIGDLVIEHGRIADLIILSQTDVSANSGVEINFVETVAMAAGRPLLVIPRRGVNKLSLDTIVVGWNGSREAARAAFDSMSFLRNAKDVLIVTIDPEHISSGAELAETMARQGVNAKIELIPSGGEEAGAVLLRKVSDVGAGLLIMGSYGHSRLREFILGGATRHVIGGMDCPVLLSH